MVVVVVSVVDAIAQQSMASLLSLTRECLLTVYVSKRFGFQDQPPVGRSDCQSVRAVTPPASMAI